MENVFKLVNKFNKEAGLLDKEYNDFLENSYIIEEALEGFNLELLADSFSTGNKLEVVNAKNLSRHIAKLADAHQIQLSDVERFDKAVDAIIFAIGGLYKMNLSPQQVQAGIAVVNQANMKKLGAPKDEFGKQTKPEGWEQYDPAPKLQAILDKRIL